MKGRQLINKQTNSLCGLDDKLISSLDDGLGNGILYCIGEAGFRHLEMLEWGVQETVGYAGLSSGAISGSEQCRGGRAVVILKWYAQRSRDGGVSQHGCWRRWLQCCRGKRTPPHLFPSILDKGMMTKAPEVSRSESLELFCVTNLRVNFSKLHTLGDRPLRGLKGYPFCYYALCEIVAQGSCLCHDHASECRPAPRTPANVEGMVSTTGGASCCWWGGQAEGLGKTLLALLSARCMAIASATTTQLVPTVSTARTCTRITHGMLQSLGTPMPAGGGAVPYSAWPYLPWVSPLHIHLPCSASECKCHGHACSCHFDMVLHLASSNVSGGVCDACQHNTAGHHYELYQLFSH
ncbi:uncharacterized protein LOC131416089 [Diceros bicornis minor]|uniref:uncharacterized protein LOC131416089 n=1 Tax=Diceros bicornis minor TaxID=77932 RepID=UPI0026EE7B08|nr:uncharacterized protein LOC131416089 [Diceros bicornis minor]